ncbi:MAG TPA: hypothetical protein VF678_06080, partial [bacterium]
PPCEEKPAMATVAQIAATRANAQKSTGPRTANGKRRVSRNAITHGLTCEAVVLKDDDRAEFEQFRASMIQDNLPVGAQEQICVERMVSAYWRLTHLEEEESDLYNIQRERMGDPNRNLGSCVLHDKNNEGGFSLLIRKEAHLDRMFHKASRRLQELQALRRKGLRHVIDEEEGQGEEAAAPAPAVTAPAAPVAAKPAPTATPALVSTPSSDGAIGNFAKQSQLVGGPAARPAAFTDVGSGSGAI